MKQILQWAISRQVILFSSNKIKASTTRAAARTAQAIGVGNRRALTRVFDIVYPCVKAQAAYKAV
ncbi:hypothetical protein A8F94_04260 [Bacillus sp. FJAT-27225]|nr:hypothetical protein A8F94_04260 [Bacillus sp. FJAT-27225]